MEVTSIQSLNAVVSERDNRSETLSYAAICSMLLSEAPFQVPLSQEDLIQQKIDAMRDSYRPIIDQLVASGEYTIYGDFLEAYQHYPLVPNKKGAGGCYLLGEEFVVKPVDEDIGCFNNKKGFAMPIMPPVIYHGIPLYESHKREIVVYDMAKMIGIDGVAVESGAMIIKGKLCVIQRYVKDSKDLIEVRHDCYEGGKLDQTDFEEMCILMTASFEQDGHEGNIRAYVKSVDEEGEKVYGLKKIDNTFSFPIKNQMMYNGIIFYPNSNESYSVAAKEKIANIPTEEIIERMKFLQFDEGSIGAFKERIKLFQELAKSDLSIRDIDQKMRRGIK